MSTVPNPSTMAGNAPKPHDPRDTGISPEEIQQRFDEALEAVPLDLTEEAAMLSRAHDVLHDALQ